MSPLFLVSGFCSGKKSIAVFRIITRFSILTDFSGAGGTRNMSIYGKVDYIPGTGESKG